MSFLRLFLFITLPLYLLDQVTKFWTVFNLKEPIHYVDMIKLVDDRIHWVRVHNQGVAFGMGNGTSWAPIVFLIVPLIALTVIRVLWKKEFFKHPLAKIAVALVLCGIFGNLTDRLIQGFLLESTEGLSFWSRLSAGYVVDFAAVKLPLYDKIVPSSGGWWPAFNVADSCIFIGAFMLFISGLKEERSEATQS